MILWFAGGACLAVWFVLHDPRLDYRLLILGALLPDAPLRLTPLHSLVFPVALLAAVMAVTRRGSAARRRALAVPIGALLHLVLDGMWSRSGVFWWPFLGGFDWASLPSLDRPLALVLVQEAAGAVALAWSLAQRSAMAADGPTC